MRMTYKKREFARQLRQGQTLVEERVWEMLRINQFMGLKFRRQHVIEGFVVDLYCHEHRLAIELDGRIHDRKMRKDYDKLRQIELEAKGITFVRVRNGDFIRNENILFKKIKEAITRPRPLGEGRKEDANS